MTEDSEEHREFMLSALRGAALRCKLYENEINSIGVALKGGMISIADALAWIKDAGVQELVCRIPKEITEQIESMGET